MCTEIAEVCYICVDDKHQIKVGEPLCPVAATEQGCKVIVQLKNWTVEDMLYLLVFGVLEVKDSLVSGF